MGNILKLTPLNRDCDDIPLTAFEQMYGTKGTHIPTESPRDYVGIPGEIMIDDEVDREKPYAKIGDGEHTFDELDYIKVVRDYYTR